MKRVKDYFSRLSADSRGISLVEVQMAAAVFLIVALAILTLYDTSRVAFKRGQEASDAQQRARLAFGRLAEDLRLAGFDYNRDGDKAFYPDQTDEQIEFVHERAVTLRANFDLLDADEGREPALEMPPGDPDFGTACCPIVTTGNDEIVTYALKSEDATANDDQIVLKLDARPTDGRDAIESSGSIINEETLTLTGIDLDGEHPPYTLYRFSIKQDGTGFDETPLVNDIRDLRFTFLNGGEEDWYCLNPQSDGSCQDADRHPIRDSLGGDDVTSGDGKGRKARAAIRHIGVEVIGMHESPDFRWSDPDAQPSDPGDALTLHQRKIAFQARVTPPNLGLKGRQAQEDRELDAPTNVTLSVGHCDTVRVEWDKVRGAQNYQVTLWDDTQNPAVKVFLRLTPGIAIPGTDPPRIYAVYQASDDPDIVNGAVLFAKVRAFAGNGAASGYSSPSDSRTLEDVVRPAMVEGMFASGYDPADPSYPDTNFISPVSDPESDDYPLENAILLQWRPPAYTLDVQDPDDPANTWDCRSNASTYEPIIDDAELATDTDGDTEPDKRRTPIREIVGDIRYLVFRSADPRFDPVESDLIADIKGEIDPETGYITYVDETAHLFGPNGAWRETLSTLPVCRTWYYRVRPVDWCWSGGDPASKTDPSLGPFYPELNQGDVRDCDDTSTLSTEDVGLAIPGYAIAAARAEAPTSVRFQGWDSTTLGFDIQFNASKQDTRVDGDGNPAPSDAAYCSYRLYSHPSAPYYELDAYGNAASPGMVHGDIVVRDLRARSIARDDEDGDGTAEDDEDETNNGESGHTELTFTAPGSTPRWYRLVAFQCEDDEIAGDGGDPTAYDFGLASDPLRIPCEFGGGPTSTITVDDSSWPDSLTAVMVPESSGIVGWKARLILTSMETGDTVESASMGIDPSGLNTFVFDSAHIEDLLEDFPEPRFYRSVEILDSQACYGVSDRTQEDNSAYCGISAGDPVAYLLTDDQSTAREPLTDTTGGDLEITYITVTIGNENGGQPERIREVYWEGAKIWQGSTTQADIDRGSDPLDLPAGATRTLEFRHSAAVTGNSLTVTLTYSDGSTTSDCEFFEDDLQEPAS